MTSGDLKEVTERHWRRGARRHLLASLQSEKSAMVRCVCNCLTAEPSGWTNTHLLCVRVCVCSYLTLFPHAPAPPDGRLSTLSPSIHSTTRESLVSLSTVQAQSKRVSTERRSTLVSQPKISDVSLTSESVATQRRSPGAFLSCWTPATQSHKSSKQPRQRGTKAHNNDI